MCHAMAAVWPRSFHPSPVGGIEAAYFTISTATTTGMGDIRPVSAGARLAVSAQMIASLYLIGIAITTAAQRVLAHDNSGGQQQNDLTNELS